MFIYATHITELQTTTSTALHDMFNIHICILSVLNIMQIVHF